MIFNILIIGPSESGKTTFLENISKKFNFDKEIHINTFEENKFYQDKKNQIKNKRKTSIGDLIIFLIYNVV